MQMTAGFKAYEMEDDVTKDLSEFALANALFAALVESHAAEQNARRNAMENASKNASEMIGRLQMQYNRGRQAVITNELIDIITGMFQCFGLEWSLTRGFSLQVPVLCRPYIRIKIVSRCAPLFDMKA